MDAIVQRAARAVALCAAAIMAAVLLDLGVRAAVRLESRWDELAYHLPFAALRGGLGIPYEMSDEMVPWYQGYPPLPHLLQGVLWRLTGSINATGVVCYLAFLAFLVYCQSVLQARWWLVALVALSAPLVLIHTTVSYIDLVGNAFLAIGFASCLYLFLHPETPAGRALAGGLAGLVAAAWSKYPMAPLVALALFMLAAVLLTCRGPGRPGSGKVIGWLGLAAVLAALPYLKNWILYGNPFWPLRFPVMPALFPYMVDPANGTNDLPPPLQGLGHFNLYLRSLLELGHPTSYPDRPRWIIDQGNAWIAFRSGGFWGFGVVFYLAATAMLLWTVHRGRGLIAAAALGFLVLFVGALPQSYELRYYLFLPLLWAAALAMAFPGFAAAKPRSALALLVVMLGMFGYMASENRTYYDASPIGYAGVAAKWAAPAFWVTMRPGETYCPVGLAPIGILLTGPTMSEFRVAERTAEGLCPADSIVLTPDGGQHRALAPR